MQGSPNAIGFVGFAFAEEAGDAVKEVAVDAGDGRIGPMAETIADGSYPLSRSLYIYPNTETAAATEALKAFVDYYLTDDGPVTAVERHATSLSRRSARRRPVRPGSPPSRDPRS